MTINSGHEITNIYTKPNDKTASTGHCHICNGPHLIKNCNESTYSRCKPNLDKHTPARCPRKHPFSKHPSSSNPHSNDNSNKTKINNLLNQTYQLQFQPTNQTTWPKLLDATRKMTKYV